MSMKMNKALLAAAVVFGMSSLAQAAAPVEQGHGTVSFTGSIIDSPCSIDPDTIDQTVDLGQVSNVVLEGKGTSMPKNFEIGLENCNIGTKSKGVSVTFTGAEGGTSGMLGLSGTAKGASIAMADSSGKVLKLGDKTAAQALQNGNNKLLFSAYLQGDGASGGIVPGDFKSVANFTLDYQ